MFAVTQKAKQATSRRGISIRIFKGLHLLFNFWVLLKSYSVRGRSKSILSFAGRANNNQCDRFVITISVSDPNEFSTSRLDVRSWNGPGKYV